MFTGLIQHVGEVRSVDATSQGQHLVVDALGWRHDPERGESIAISGCCLTVVESHDGNLSFDVVHQTLRETTIGNLKSGDRVNLEHAATPTTLLGGHIVQGHIDGVGLAQRTPSDDAGEVCIRIEPPDHLMPYLTPRGSVTVDGVSLTIAEHGDSWFDVALIPTTLELTTLDRIGDSPLPVNLETDCIVRAVVHWLERRE